MDTTHPSSSHVCTDCTTEDKLYEAGRCAHCALRRRTGQLLRGAGDLIPPALAPVYAAIIATDTPRSALNWLRNGSGPALLANMAVGPLGTRHQSPDPPPTPAGTAPPTCNLTPPQHPPHPPGPHRPTRLAHTNPATRMPTPPAPLPRTP